LTEQKKDRIYLALMTVGAMLLICGMIWLTLATGGRFF
jgi:hypothetical protein